MQGWHSRGGPGCSRGYHRPTLPCTQRCCGRGDCCGVPAAAPRPLLPGLPWAERGAGPLLPPGLGRAGRRGSSARHSPSAPSASALLGQARPCAFREPGGRGKCALPPQPAALSAGSLLRVLLGPSLTLSRPQDAPSPCPSCAAVQGLRCRGCAAPLAGGLRGWWRVPPTGPAGCGPSASSRCLPLALRVCPQPPARGKGSSPQHLLRQQLFFIPEQVPQGPGNAAVPEAPLLVLRAARSVAVPCPRPSGTVGPGFRLSLLPALSECCATFIGCPQVSFCLFPQTASLGFLCICSRASEPGVLEQYSTV